MLVGRDREERLLDKLLDEARAGQSGVLALIGEVGIGKSALLDFVAARTTDMNVLRARGVESEARIPFGSLFELLRPALDHLSDLARPQREALEGALALRPARRQDRFAIGAATLSLLSAYAEEAPLAILVDDAQWLDGSTADALLFAFRRLVADSIAVVLAVREGLPSLLDGSDIPVHVVRGLDRPATASLLARSRHTGLVLTDEVIDHLQRGTGGNPLAVIELADDLATMPTLVEPSAPLPVGDRVARAYLDRWAAMDEPARDVVVLAAVSDSGDLALLAKAAEAARLDLADLGAAEHAGLVTISGNRFEFCHPLARSAVYRAASPERRRSLHRAMASVLPDADADRRAWHLASAALGRDDAASSSLEQAGRRASGRSAYDVASRAFERAAELSVEDHRRPTLLYEAASAAWLGGLATRAVELLDRARAQAPVPEVALPIEHLRGHIATRCGPLGEARQILVNAATAGANVDCDRAVVMLAEAVNAAFYACDAAAMRAIGEQIVPLAARSTGRQSEFFGAMAAGMAMIFSADGDRSHESQGVALVRRAVELIATAEEVVDDPRLLAWAAMGPLWLREADPTGALVGSALAAARERSAVGVLPFLLSHVAIDHAATDRWREAEAGFHEAIDLARESGQHTDLAFSLARLALLEARQGKEDFSRAHAIEARELASRLGVGLADVWSLAALGELELGRGRVAEAVEYFELQESALREHGVGDVDLAPAPELVDLELRLGRRADAASRLERFEEAAGAKGQPWALARALRCRGMLAGDDEFDHWFNQSISMHALTPDSFEAARTRLAHGRRLRRARQRVRSREVLRAALEIFERLGAAPWADMARTELAATGETARRREASTRDHLTPQELRIALLLSSGHTTRAAAAALFVSPKTIEYHLRSIYRKLGINSRDELAAALGSS